jgi:rod shape-determining protein MreC
MKLPKSQSWSTITLIVVVAGLIIFALSGYMQPAIRVFLTPVIGIQEWISSRYAAIYDFVTVPRDVASLRARNEELEKEISSLQTRIIDLNQQLSEAEVLYALLGYQRDNLQSKYITAAVIGRDPNPFMSYILIDQGSDNGLRRGMPVITDQGLVGRIDAVTATGARVQLITDASSVVNVQMDPDRGDAQIQGSLTGDISINMVSQDINLQVGDLVLTSGLGGSFPSGLLIGQVASVRSQVNELFQSATVQPVVDFTTLQAVLVVTDFKQVDVSPLIPTSSP